MVVNFWGLYKYVSKYTGSQTNIQAKIGGTYKWIRMDRVYIQEVTVVVYIQEVKYMRRQIYEDSTFEWLNTYLVKTNIIVTKIVSIRATKTKLL